MTTIERVTEQPIVDEDHPVVDVVFCQEWDYEHAMYGAPEWGDWQAMAEYLTQWDYGDETDAAHIGADWKPGSNDDTYLVSTGGLDYWLTVNSDLRYAGLTRRPTP